MIPAWLRAHLEDTGAMVDGITRAARPSRCKGCGATVVRGLTGQPLSELATVDPAPLSSLGELQAVMGRRATYDLARRAGRLELDGRDSFHIEGSPADSPDGWRRRGDVVAAHECGSTALDSRDSRIGSGL